MRTVGIFVLWLFLVSGIPGQCGLRPDIKDRVTDWEIGGEKVGLKFRINHEELVSADKFVELSSTLSASTIPPPFGEAVASAIAIGYAALRGIDLIGGQHGVFICWTPVRPGYVLPLPADEMKSTVAGNPSLDSGEPEWRDVEGFGIDGNLLKSAEIVNNKTLSINITSIEATKDSGGKIRLKMQIQQGIKNIQKSQVVFGRFVVGEFAASTRQVTLEPNKGPVRFVHKNIETAARDFEKQHPDRQWFAFRDVVFLYDKNDKEKNLILGGFRVVVKDEGHGIEVLGGRGTQVNKLGNDRYWFKIRGIENGYSHDFIVHAVIGGNS